MDTTTKKHDLVTDAVAAAKAHGLNLEIAERAPRGGDRQRDAAIKLRVGHQETEYLVEVRKGLRPATLGGIVLRLQELEQLGVPVMLVTDYVTPQIAEKLRDQAVTFLDAAGNLFIDHPPLLFWVKGERPAAKPTAQMAHGRAFQPTGLKVVFALLCQPERIELPYREIAQLAGVAHGTVGWVMTDLVESGFVITLEGQQRRLRNRRRLLDIWIEAYARVLRQKLLLGRFRAPQRDWWRNVKFQDYGLQLGGEPAAAELDDYLIPGTTTCYGTRVPGKFLAEQRLKTDAKGDVELRQRFWNFTYDWQWPALVPPILIYADLLAIGDARCVEAAKRIYEAHIARFLEQD